MQRKNYFLKSPFKFAFNEKMKGIYNNAIMKKCMIEADTLYI